MIMFVKYSSQAYGSLWFPKHSYAIGWRLILQTHWLQVAVEVESQTNIKVWLLVNSTSSALPGLCQMLQK